MDRFFWSDGGRAAAGYVGSCGDCVVRAIAIGTGQDYRTVYDRLFDLKGSTPRNGNYDSDYGEYLEELGWIKSEVDMPFESTDNLPKGVVILQLEGPRTGHLCCVVDGTVVDTWNPIGTRQLKAIWVKPDQPVPSLDDFSSSEERNEMEKVMRRLRAMDRTIKDNASTKGERDNAIRMMQAIMLKNNIKTLESSEVDPMSQFSIQHVNVNGIRPVRWERGLAHFVCNHVVQSVRHYGCRENAKRFKISFFGPRFDVQYSVEIYRELLVTIAAASRLEHGGYARGKAADFCEGFVRGLPKEETSHTQEGLIATSRYLSVHAAAKEWLFDEFGIRLVNGSRSHRKVDLNAMRQGEIAGARQEIRKANRQPKLGFNPRKIEDA